MHDVTAPLSREHAAALHRLWKAPTAGNCLRVSREIEAPMQAQVNDWEAEGDRTFAASSDRELTGTAARAVPASASRFINATRSCDGYDSAPPDALNSAVEAEGAGQEQ